MNNLGSGMDGILKMIIGVLAICGVLIMVVTNVDLTGGMGGANTGSNGLPPPESNVPAPLPGQAPGAPKPTAAPAPGTAAQSAVPAVPAKPAVPSYSPAGRQFGDPMMDPSPIGMDGRPMTSQNQTSPSPETALPPPESQTPNSAPAPAPSGNQSAPVNAPAEAI